MIKFKKMDPKFILSGKAAQRYVELNEALLKFSELFVYNAGDDRAIVIIGGSYLDIVLEHVLRAFFPEDDSEVERLIEYNQPLGTFGNRVRMVYCLGLIEKIVKDDLKLIGKIRNQFAHDLYASFEDKAIKSWCRELKWHKVSMMMEPPADATIRDLYQVGVNQLISYLNGAIAFARGNKRTVIQNYKV
ncbi:MltR family transcriptional regulator [Pedobacter sp. P26]|uniref:MltR family transcriptional regulator n=1 Tax=Pedobacter sp. P26 TaxID=3423956 RepID=UPI003D66907B